MRGQHIIYGPGGFDPDADDGNVVEVIDLGDTDDPHEQARDRFREAVSNASSIADLKAALLGTDTDAEPDVRPGRGA